MILPTPDDHTEVIHGLIRLQKTYKLATTDLAKGILYNMSAYSGMDKHDCLKMGINWFPEDHQQALTWFELVVQDEVADNDMMLTAYNYTYHIHLQVQSSLSIP